MIQTKSVVYCCPVDKPSGDTGQGCDCDIELEDVSHIGDQSDQDMRFARPGAPEHRSEKLCPRVQCLDAIVERGFLCRFEAREHRVDIGLGTGTKVAEFSGFVVAVVFLICVHFVIQRVVERFVLHLEIGKVIVGEVRIELVLVVKVLYPITDAVEVDVFDKRIFYDGFDIFRGRNQTADAAVVHVRVGEIVFAEDWLVAGEAVFSISFCI